MRDLRNLFLLLVLTSVSLACREEKTAKNLIYVGPKSELTDIDMVYSDSARTVVRMVTPSQITLYSEDRVYPKEVKLWFYDKMGNVTSQVRGDSAHFFRQKNSYKMMGNVVIFNVQQAETLKTEEFTWLPEEKRVFTDKPVQIRTKKEIIYGVGMDAAQDFTHYSLGHVTNSVLTVESLPTN